MQKEEGGKGGGPVEKGTEKAKEAGDKAKEMGEKAKEGAKKGGSKSDDWDWYLRYMELWDTTMVHHVR